MVRLFFIIFLSCFSFGFAQDKLGMGSYSRSYSYNSPANPCEWWNDRLNSGLSTFAWQRHAYIVCKDYHSWDITHPKKPKPDSLIAAWDVLEEYKRAFIKRTDMYLLLGRLAMYAPSHEEEKEIERYRKEKFLFNPKTPDILAEEVGLLLVLESIENGY